LWQSLFISAARKLMILTNGETRIRELSALIANAPPGEDVTALLSELKALIHEYLQSLRAKARSSFPGNGGDPR